MHLELIDVRLCTLTYCVWFIRVFGLNPMKISKLTVLMASWKARRIGDCTCKLVDYETWKNCLDLIAVNGLQSLISGHQTKISDADTVQGASERFIAPHIISPPGYSLFCYCQYSSCSSSLLYCSATETSLYLLYNMYQVRAYSYKWIRVESIRIGN